MNQIFEIIGWLVNSNAVQGGGITKTQAILNLIKCQFRFRILRQKRFRFNWVYGIKMEAIRGEHGSTIAYYLGLHDYYEMTLLHNYLSHDDCFLDVGANMGTYSMIAAHTGASVYSFEAIPTTAEKLKHIIELNPSLIKKIKIIPAAVNDVSGIVTMTDGDISSLNHILDKNDGQISTEKYITVNAICLDEIETDKPVAAMKIDVEGAEESVLKGAKKILENEALSIIIMEVLSNEDKCLTILRDYGFNACRYDIKNNVVALDSKATYDKNQIFVRNVRAINQKLANLSNRWSV